ncbi:hypothetical protein ACRALDRAFT_1067140 [Sodiomyces alcalophilus JCM 7366]|uniref:uncharacterized protein n=1 Tax=Sodiomyces alcalophilus JCM 7366 TaxID=591952 RepID=UPI0039B43745
MAISGASPKQGRDYFYLAIFTIQLCAMLLVDLPPLYPSHLWEPEGSPLNILLGLRGLYAKWTNDPYFVTPHAELPPWFRLFTFIEAGYQLPMALWMFRVFKDSRRGTTPGFELACVVFGLQVALTSLVCVWDVAYWDPSVYSVCDKNMFVFAIYGPWVIIRMLCPYSNPCTCFVLMG